MTRLVVGRIGRARGVRGEVTVQVHTDVPEVRFAPGTQLDTDPHVGPLTVAACREQSGCLVVRFAGVVDRAAAAALGTTLLVVDASSSPPSADPDEYWDHELIGLSAGTVAGEPLGEVVAVVHPPGGDLLVVRRDDDRELLVPFVADIVPAVDVATGRLVVDPPEGLLDL